MPICAFFDIIVYTEYFFNRGISWRDLFITSNSFEKFPLIYYMLVIIGDGIFYMFLEFFAIRIFNFFLLKENDMKNFVFDKKVSCNNKYSLTRLIPRLAIIMFLLFFCYKKLKLVIHGYCYVFLISR